MAIKAFSECNRSLSKVVSTLIFPSKMSGLDTGDYKDDDFEEVSKGCYLTTPTEQKLEYITALIMTE